jgi:tetratricopeptide (TPR) repeat protein
MHTDRQSNPLAGATSRATDLFDAACEGFALYRGDPFALLEEALAEAPGFAMARLVQAWMLALATEPEASAAARALLDGLRTTPLPEREAGHAAALDHALAGEWTRASHALDHHLAHFPRDLPAVQAGHLLDFLRADAGDLRDRIARVLPAWRGVPGRSFLLGMHAFGLEEMGDHEKAEATGRAALEEDPRDAWAHHAVAHVMEMQGRPAEGLAWITGRAPHWAAPGGFFQVHNWWHQALCHIELGDPGAALALLDGPIEGGRSVLAMDLVDAAALLWRLDLAGMDVGSRWQPVSELWTRHADGHLYPFNDLHAAMAHLGARRMDRLEALLGRMREAAGATNETAGWIARTGLPLVEGFAAFHRGDHARAARQLHGARRIANSFGGSHAQRDVIDWTLTEAALRAGDHAMAEALAHERLALRPHSPVNRAFLARTQAMAA